MLDMLVVFVIADVRRESGDEFCSIDGATELSSGENGKMSFGVLGRDVSASAYIENGVVSDFVAVVAAAMALVDFSAEIIQNF